MGSKIYFLPFFICYFQGFFSHNNVVEITRERSEKPRAAPLLVRYENTGVPSHQTHALTHAVPTISQHWLNMFRYCECNGVNGVVVDRVFYMHHLFPLTLTLSARGPSLYVRS